MNNLASIKVRTPTQEGERANIVNTKQIELGLAKTGREQESVIINSFNKGA